MALAIMRRFASRQLSGCFGSGKIAIDSMVLLCTIRSYDRNGFDDCGFIQGALLFMLFCCAAVAGFTGAHGS